MFSTQFLVVFLIFVFLALSILYTLYLLVKEKAFYYRNIKPGDKTFHKKYKVVNFKQWLKEYFFSGFKRKGKHYSFFESLWLIAVHRDFKIVRKMFLVYLIFLVVLLAGGFFYLKKYGRGVFAGNVTDDTEAEFNAGVYNDTQYNNVDNWVELTGSGKSNGFGDYTSSVKDAGSSVSWQNISWIPNFPTGKELPNNKGVETGYPNGNVDMSGNVLLLHFNESVGSIVFDDTSGEYNDANCSGSSCPTAGVSGIYNTAVQFDGVDDKLDCGITGMSSTLPITLEAWVKFLSNSNSTGYMYVLKTSTFTNGDVLAIARQNSTQRIYYVEGSAPRFGPAVGLNQWFHIVFVFSSSTSVEAYINGIPVSIDQPVSSINPTGLSCTIGYWQNTFPHFLNGVIDEVAVYQRALSASEVFARYKRGITKLKFQVRSCDDPSCSGEIFIGPDGTSSSYYEWGTLNSIDLPDFPLSNLSDNRYFQYKVFFETLNSSFSPELKAVDISNSALSGGGSTNAPTKPVNKSPLDQETVFTVNPVLKASSFSDPNGDAHSATQWQIDDESDFSSPVWEKESSIPETSTQVLEPDGRFTNELSGKKALLDNTSYYWRVRYKDSSGEWSEWSDPTLFKIDRSKKLLEVKIEISGSRFSSGDIVEVKAQVRDSLTSNYINQADVEYRVYDNKGTEVLSRRKMSFVSGSDGVYKDSFQIDFPQGGYTVEVDAVDNRSGQSGKGIVNFSVGNGFAGNNRGFGRVLLGSAGGRVFDFEGGQGNVYEGLVDKVLGSNELVLQLEDRDVDIGLESLILFVTGENKGRIFEIERVLKDSVIVKGEVREKLVKGDKVLVFTGIRRIDAVLEALNYLKNRLRNRSEEEIDFVFSSALSVYDLIYNLGKIDREFLEVNISPLGTERYDLYSLAGKLEDLTATASLIKGLQQTDYKESLYVRWYTFGSVNLNVMGINPTKNSVSMDIVLDLPQDIKREDIINKGRFVINENSEKRLSASLNLTLEPSRVFKYSLKMQDVWDIDSIYQDILSIKNNIDRYRKDLDNSFADAKAKRLYAESDDIFNRVNRRYLTVEEKISVYQSLRDYKERLDKILAEIDSVYALYSNPISFVGSLISSNIALTAGILLSIFFTLFMIWVILYAMWRHHMKIAIELSRKSKDKHMSEQELQYYLDHPIVIEDIREVFSVMYNWIPSRLRTFINLHKGKIVFLLILSFVFLAGVRMRIIDPVYIFSNLYNDAYSLFKKTSLFKFGSSEGKSIDSVDKENLYLTSTPTSTPTSVPTPTFENKKSSELKILDTPTGFLNVRKGPGVNFAILDRVKPGRVYEYLNKETDSRGRLWYEIKLSDNITGWVIEKYVRLIN